MVTGSDLDKFLAAMDSLDDLLAKLRDGNISEFQATSAAKELARKTGEFKLLAESQTAVDIDVKRKVG